MMELMPSPATLRAASLLLLLAGCGRDASSPGLPALPLGTVEFTPAQMATARLAFDTVRLVPVGVPLLLPGRVDTPDPATAHVGSIVEGRIEEVRVLPGDRVRAGDLLVRIHSHELATAQRDLAAATGVETAARAALERSTRLLAAGAVSREEVEERQSALASASAERARAAEIVEHLHPVGTHVTIRAPVDGVVFEVQANVGDAILTGAPLVTLGDDRTLWVTGWIPEAAVPAMAGVHATRVTFPALPGDTVAGDVVHLGARIDSLHRAAPVRVRLESRLPGLRPGMNAVLHLATGAAHLRAILPAEAVQRGPGGMEVYVVDAPNRFRRLPVTGAITLSDDRVAVEGLREGLVVVGRGAYLVRSALDAEAPE